MEASEHNSFEMILCIASSLLLVFIFHVIIGFNCTDALDQPLNSPNIHLQVDNIFSRLTEF